MAIFHSFSVKIRHHATVTLQQKQKLATNLGLEMKNVCLNYKYNLNQNTDSEVTVSHKWVKARWCLTWKKISRHAKLWFKKKNQQKSYLHNIRIPVLRDMTLHHCASRTNFSKGHVAFNFKDSTSMFHSYSIISQNPQNPWSNDSENPKTHNKTFTHGYVWVRLNLSLSMRTFPLQFRHTISKSSPSMVRENLL